MVYGGLSACLLQLLYSLLLPLPACYSYCTACYCHCLPATAIIQPATACLRPLLLHSPGQHPWPTSQYNHFTNKQPDLCDSGTQLQQQGAGWLPSLLRDGRPVLQQLLRLDAEATALDTKIEAAVAKMEAAATAEGDRPMFTKIYDNLVADKRHLNARRAVLEAQLVGTSKHLCMGGGEVWAMLSHVRALADMQVPRGQHP